MSVLENKRNLYDPVSRIQDKEIYCSGNNYTLSGKNYSSEFHAELNLYYDTYINELSPNRSFDDLYSSKDVMIFLSHLEEIAGKKISDITSTTTRYGTMSKVIGEEPCPQNFTLVNIKTKYTNIFEDQPNDANLPCIKSCFSGEITSDEPILL